MTTTDHLAAATLVGRHAAAAAVLAALVANPSSARAGEASEFHGSFQEQVPIAVPPFHGAEPGLSLGYDSAGGNGFAGVGWSLSGFSVIERAAPGRGAPRYDGNDIYLLDGQELVVHTGLGGTHATKVQSYARIQKDVPAAGQWTVTQKNGTRAVYSAVYATAGGTFRWGLTSIIDTSGNTASYGWWCDGGLDCYPSTVAYNGTTVSFHRELRPDPITFANGKTQGRTNYRLKSVDVVVSGSRARAYKLTYTTSASTSRSQLAAVQQFGRDATVDGAGNVTGGTALPSMTASYAAEPGGVFTSTQWISWCSGYGVGAGDFNGDGRMDLQCHNSNGGNNWVALSNGDGTFTSVFWASWCSGYGVELGDFDGDGRTDLQCHNNSGGNNWVALSNGNGSFTSVFWASWCSGYGVGLGDFNGDGRTDLQCHNTEDGNNWVALSNGDGSFASIGWISWCGGYGLGFGDFNGDGKTDLQCHNSQHGNNWVALSNGNGTFASVGWSVWCQGYGVGLGDFNGDGKTDLQCHNTSGGNNWVAFSNGDGSFTSIGWVAWCGGYGVGLGDFNGDGKTDLQCHNTSDGNNWVALSGDAGGFTSLYWGSWCTGYGVGIGDFNGDGKADLQCHNSSNGANWVAVAGGGATGMPMVSVANGLGGSTAVTYTSSSAWSNTNNPPVAQTVTQVVQSDGRGWSSTSSYSYAGGLFDRLERRFLGFHYAKATSPCIPGEASCPYEETWFRQDYGSVSKPERVDSRDGAGRLLSSVNTTYVTNGATVPYQSIETMSWSHAYDGSGAVCGTWPCAYGKRTAVSRTWDVWNGSSWVPGYGNVLVEVAYGDYDVGGDEKTIRTTYRPNSSAYVVGLPAALDTFHGTTTGGTLLAQSTTCYDGSPTEGQGCWDRTPGRGKPTQACAWLDTNGTFVCTRSEYDSWGNVTAEVDPLGNRTSYTIDATYRMFVVQKLNPLGQGMSNQYDPLCGVVTSATDANGQVATTSYDALCRPTRTDKPGGGYEKLSYVGTGNPGAQHLLEERGPPPAGVTGDLFTRTYTDGLGRKYLAVSRGPVAGRDIHQEQFFNPRGSPSRSCTPYYSNEAYTSVCTVPSYDAGDRVTRFSLPDGRFGTMSYGLGWSLATDPDGRQVKSVYDSAGNLIERHERLGGTWAITRSEYDVRGNPTRILDPGGAAVTMVYDSLGRRTSVTDANAGTRTMAYDAAGRLSSVTDGIGQRVEHSYDLLGRPVSKLSRRADGSVERTVSYAYDQPRAGAFNVGMLTTVTDPSGTTTHDYDASGELIAKTRIIDGVAYTSRWKYDAAGRLLGTRFADGDVIGDDPTTPTAEPAVVYNSAGTLASIPQVVTALTYDASGRVTRQDNANGTVDISSYDYQRGWLNGQMTTRGATTLQNLAYRRSPAGQITRVESPFSNESWDYEYDSLGRLTGAWVIQLTTTTTTTCQTVCDNFPMALPGGGDCHQECWPTTTSSWTRPGTAYDQTWSHDAAGNMTWSSRLGSYTYGSGRPHAVTQAGSNAYSYDANGNLLAGAGRTLTWSAEDRLAQVTAGGTSWNYTYDAAGFRIKKSGGGQTTITPEASYEVTAGVVTKYVALPLGKHKRVGASPYWLHLDHQGSVRVVTDSAGQEVQHRKYGPYGDTLSSSTGHSESLGFVGQRADETGLVYLDARYYDPVLGRFLSPDPIAAPSAAHMNRYSYAGNDPVNNADPDGLFFKAIGKFFKKLGKAISKALAWLNKIPGLTTIASILCPAIGVALAVANVAAAAFQGDWKGVALAVGGMVLGAQAAGLTGRLGLMARAAVGGAVGAATGFGTALAYGASLKQALRAGAIGGATSVATTYLTVAVNAWRHGSGGGGGDGPAPADATAVNIEMPIERRAVDLGNGTVYEVGSNAGTNPDKVWVHVMGSVGSDGAAATLEGAITAAALISKETGLMVIVVPNANECGCTGFNAIGQALGFDVGGAGGRGIVGDVRTQALLGEVITHYGKANIAGISAFSQGAAIVNGLNVANGPSNGISKHYFNPAIMRSAGITDAANVRVYSNFNDVVWANALYRMPMGYIQAGASITSYWGWSFHDQFGPISRLRR